MTNREAFAWRISNKVGAAEVKASRALGADWMDSYLSGWRTADAVTELILGQRTFVDIPARVRMIAGRGEPW